MTTTKEREQYRLRSTQPYEEFGGRVVGELIGDIDSRDSEIATLVGLLQFLLDSGVLDGVEIDDVDPKKAIRAALENNRGGK